MGRNRGHGFYQTLLQGRVRHSRSVSDENAQGFTMKSTAYLQMNPYSASGARHSRSVSDENAQITIEGILLLGFFIIIFISISLPSALRVSSSSNDVASVLEAQNNLNKISSALETVAAGQKGSVRTVTIVSNIANWEMNTNSPTDGINPTPKRPVLNYEISIWDSDDKVPAQLYRIRSSGGVSWGAVTVLDIPGVSTGESAGLGQRKCSHQGDGKGTWDVRIENNASTSAPYIVFNTASPSADCTPSNTMINMYLVG